MWEGRHETVFWLHGGAVLLTCVSARPLVKGRTQGSMQGSSDADPSFRDGQWSDTDRREQKQGEGGQHGGVHHLP